MGTVTDYPVFKNCRLEHCGVKVHLKQIGADYMSIKCFKCKNHWIIDI